MLRTCCDECLDDVGVDLHSSTASELSTLEAPVLQTGCSEAHLEQVISGHTRLSRDTSGNDDKVSTLQCFRYSFLSVPLTPSVKSTDPQYRTRRGRHCLLRRNLPTLPTLHNAFELM